MSDFDNLFSNGANGSGLDDHEGAPLLFVATDYDKEGFKDPTGKIVATVDATIINFSDPASPRVDDGVRIFSGRLVTSLKTGALFNMQHPEGDSETRLPRMTVGTLVKGQKAAGRTAPWLLNPIEDKDLLSTMAAYARANLKRGSDNPFSNGE